MSKQLGAIMRDTVTGFEGVVVNITTWLNGCVRYGLKPRELRDGVPIATQHFDVEQLEPVRGKRPSVGKVGKIKPAKLGSKMRDTITGYEGTVVATLVYINGTRTAALQAGELKDGKPHDNQWFDVERLEPVAPAPVRKTRPSGGPQSDAAERSGPSR